MADLADLELTANTVQGPIQISARGAIGCREITVSLPSGCEGEIILRREKSITLDHAVSGLRRASQQQDLPLGLLTRVWLRSLTGPHTGPESAQSDLDEAWEIAERGSMKLFLTDIHLYRARLFFREKPYPWTSPQADLAAARHLIERCGYWRRKAELEDAEEVAKHW